MITPRTPSALYLVLLLIKHSGAVQPATSKSKSGGRPSIRASTEVQRCTGSGWSQDPVIIGGAPDSGTRGALAVLVDGFGMTACNHTEIQIGRNHMDSGDDTVVTRTIGDLWRSTGTTISALGVPPSKVSSASFDDSFKYTMMGAEWASQAGRTLCQAVSESGRCAKSGGRWSSGMGGGPAPVADGLWGFKVPRTGTMVALWDLIVPSHRFVHATRDPRQTCHDKSNKIMFGVMCRAMFGNDNGCKLQSKKLCYIYWGRYNLYVHNFYNRDQSRAARYLLAPIEDLVGAGASGSERQRRLFAAMREVFGPSTPQDRIALAMREESRHRGSMERVFEKGSNPDWQGALKDDGFRHAMCTFGYSVHREGRANATELEECQRKSSA